VKLDEIGIAAAKELGLRFTLVGVLPIAALALYVVALIVSMMAGGSPDLTALAKFAHGLTAADALVLVGSIVVLAFLLQPLQLALVRLLEGYWGSSCLARVADRIAVAWHRWRRQKLEAASQSTHKPSTDEAVEMAAAARRLRRFYPAPDRLLPTMLGNVLRAAEDKADVRYGLDTVVIWPRLYYVLSEALQNSLADQRNQLDIAARLCVVFVLAVIASAALLYRHGWWNLAESIAVVLAWMSYRSAIAAALAYGESIQAAIDLHRFDLLKALHLPPPPDREAERAANRLLCDFLRQGMPVNFIYQHPDSESE
jgi:hypothetical protein